MASRKGRTTAKVYKDRAGAWRFRLQAANGEVISGSEAYTRASSARRGARRISPSAEIVQLPAGERP